MAREIVITSVPRGVRPGRTGFQIAMRTAGLREDICDQLEPLGVYRHLPPGTGPNPECYFHKIVQTNVGPLQVLGRVVDAGADYSSRSNKLAHLVAIDQGELHQLRQSSPAAVLRAIDGRLARTWPGGPEERPQPLSLGGVPAVSARICTGWQQATGDAGWGGVLAELAVKNRPALVIAPDSSPHWCRQLLALFEEALALVPANRRWNVTFDTTVLSQAAVTWRGTYAGSPESGQRSGNMVVIDLSGRPAVPADYAGSTLVDQARRGAPVMVPSGPAPVGPKPPPVGDDWNFPPVGPPVPIGGKIPPPPPGRSKIGPGHQYDDPKTNHWKIWVAVAGLLAILLLIGLVGVVYMLDLPGMVAKGQAKKAINAWAKQHDGQPPGGKPEPAVEKWLTAYGEAKGEGNKRSEGLERARLQSVLPLMNESLLTEKVTPETISDLNAVIALVTRVQQLKDGSIDEAGLVELGLRLQEPAGARPALVGWVNEMIKPRTAPEGGANEEATSEPITLRLVQDWIDTLQPLAVLTLRTQGVAESGARSPAVIEPEQIKPALELLLRPDPGSSDGHIAQLEANPQLLVDVKSREELRQKLKPPPKDETEPIPSPPRGAVADSKKAEEDRKKAEQVAKQKNRDTAWQQFVTSVKNPANDPKREWEKDSEIVLVKELSSDIPWDEVAVRLGHTGTWKPTAEKTKDKIEWKLTGLPGKPKHLWGTIAIQGEPGSQQLVFTKQEGAPWYCGFVPIVFARDHGKKQAEKPQSTVPMRLSPQPQKISWKGENSQDSPLLSFIDWDQNQGDPIPIEYKASEPVAFGEITSLGTWDLGNLRLQGGGADEKKRCWRFKTAKNASENEGQIELFLQEQDPVSTGAKLTLSEDFIEWKFNPQAISLMFSRSKNQAEPWSSRKDRWGDWPGLFDTKNKSSADLVAQLSRLGIKYENSRIVSNKLPKWDKTWFEVVAAAEKTKDPQAKLKNSLEDLEKKEAWPKKQEEKDEKEKTLLQRRLDIETLVLTKRVIHLWIEQHDRVEDDQGGKVRKPIDLGPNPDEKKKKQHAEELEKYRAAIESSSKKIVRDPQRLREMIVDPKMDEKYKRALTFLAEFDGLVVAKVHQKDIRDSLEKASVKKDLLSLFHPRLMVKWSFDGVVDHEPIEDMVIEVAGFE